MQDKIIKYLPKIDNYNPNLLGNNNGMIVDVEATSPDPETAKIIQLSIIPFTFTDDLEICRVNEKITMFNDPGEPISEEITKLTGITDEMVKGHKLNHNLIQHTIQNMEISIAHNAKFDRNIIERNVDVPQIVWGCSMNDIDYKAKFINSRTLDYIAFRNGFWFEGHDATEDCYALLHILATAEYEGKSYFSEMMENVYAPTYKIILRNTDYNDNQILKAGKFRWFPDEKYWYREFVKEDELEEIRENTVSKLSKVEPTKVKEDLFRRYRIA